MADRLVFPETCVFCPANLPSLPGTSGFALRNGPFYPLKGIIHAEICTSISCRGELFGSLITNSVILRRTGALFLSGGGFGGRIVAATMVVGGNLSAGASAAQHCCQCWPDVQCETDPSMYLYVLV